jgi:CheY-like chemotaxis protein
MAMPSDVLRSAPFNVLVVLADAGLNVAEILPALKPHYALICASPAQALDAARQFEPDVVMIDLRMPDAGALVRDLSLTVYGRKIVFVAMSSTSGSPITSQSEFQYGLQIPATAGEMEQLLWQIGGGLAARTPHAGRPDSEMIG